MNKWIPEIFLALAIVGIVFIGGFTLGRTYNCDTHHPQQFNNIKEGSSMNLEKLYSLLQLARNKKFVEGIEPVIIKIPNGQTFKMTDVHLVMERGQWSLQLSATEERQESLILETIPGPRAVVDL